jgi:hypothetical protein
MWPDACETEQLLDSARLGDAEARSVALPVALDVAVSRGGAMSRVVRDWAGSPTQRGQEKAKEPRRKQAE